jgi:hypothetical protein
MAVIALISCTKSKLSHACAAKELYSKSNLFRHSYDYAELIADKIYVLSAKHGLVDENDVIEPYDETLLNKSAKEKEKWAMDVLKSLTTVSDLSNDQYVILAGKVYYEKLLPGLKNYRIPLEGVSLFGRPGVLKELTAGKQPILNSRVSTPAGKEQGIEIARAKSGSREITALIDKLLDEARADGQKYLDLISGNIHKQLGLKNRNPQVCDAMYKKMGSRDEVIKTTPSGYSSTITIRYRLD